MKRFKLALSSLCAFMGFTHLAAAPIQSPSSPCFIQEGIFIPKTSNGTVRAGYEGDFIGNAKFEQINQSSGQVDQYSQNSHRGVATLNFFNRLDFYSLFGIARTNADWRFTNETITHRVELETLSHFIWGIGARGILWANEVLILGLGGRYEQSHQDNLWMTIDGEVHAASGSTLDWRVWQMDLSVSYQIDIFSPYIGLKYSNALTKIDRVPFAISNAGIGSNQFKNHNPIGLVIGCALSSGKTFMLTVEGRLIDEEAVTISGDFRF